MLKNKKFWNSKSCNQNSGEKKHCKSVTCTYSSVLETLIKHVHRNIHLYALESYFIGGMLCETVPPRHIRDHLQTITVHKERRSSLGTQRCHKTRIWKELGCARRRSKWWTSKRSSLTHRHKLLCFAQKKYNVKATIEITRKIQVSPFSPHGCTPGSYFRLYCPAVVAKFHLPS